MTVEEIEAQIQALKEALSAITTAIKNNVTFPHSMSIAGRAVTYRSLTELLRARSEIVQEISRLERAKKILEGTSDSLGSINVRF